MANNINNVVPINHERLQGYNLQGQYIPPTPGPRSKLTLQENARERFAGILWVSRAANKTSADYLADYDFVEPYDDTKSYSKRLFTAVHNGCVNNYHNYLCVITGDDNSEEYYVVAKGMRHELAELEPYCTCITCCSSVCNPLKYLWCPTCTRCLKAGPSIANPQFIQRAQQLRVLHENAIKQPRKWEQYITPSTLVRTCELLTLLVFTVIAIYLK